MGNLSKKKKQDKYAKHKLAAIPILLLVLGYVLFSGGSDKAEKKPELAKQQSKSAENQSRVEPATPVWEEVDWDFLSGPNPFASYHHVDKPAEKLVARQDRSSTVEHATLDQLKQRVQNLPAVRYHFQSDTQNVVMLGEELLSAGDSYGQDLELGDIRDGQLIFRVQKSSNENFQ